MDIPPRFPTICTKGNNFNAYTCLSPGRKKPFQNEVTWRGMKGGGAKFNVVELLPLIKKCTSLPYKKERGTKSIKSIKRKSQLFYTMPT